VDGRRRRSLSRLLAVLVLDEQLAGKSLVAALRARGLEVLTLADLGLTGRPDPDVVRQVDERHNGAWVLVTMDLTVIEDHPGFDWGRYAIAWVLIREDLRGADFEAAKHNVVHRWALEILEQRRGDHHTHTVAQRHKSPPSLNAQLRRGL